MQIQTLVAFNLLLIIVDDQPERIDFSVFKGRLPLTVFKTQSKHGKLKQ